MSSTEKRYKKNNYAKKVLTNQNSPASIKLIKYINNNSNSNTHKNIKTIEIKGLSEKKRNKKKFVKEEKQINIPKTININSKTKELELKKLKKYHSPNYDREEDGNSILMKKLKNIGIQMDMLKAELKRYKKIEKNSGIKQIKNSKLKRQKNIEKIKDERYHKDKEKKYQKFKNITIDVVYDNKNFSRTMRNSSNNSGKATKKIITDFINELFDDKTSSTTTINNKAGSRFTKLNNNKLIKYISTNSKDKNQRKNKSYEHRKRIKKNNLSYSTNNITEINKSKNKNQNRNINATNFNKDNKNLSPIKKIKHKKLEVKSERKKNVAKNEIEQTKDKSLSSHLNSKSNLKLVVNENNEQSNELLRKAKEKIKKSKENLEKNNNRKFCESKIKNQLNISLESITQKKGDEKDILKEKSIFQIEKLCKKGYDGESKDKINQDNFFIYNNFNNDSNSIYMGVCDGHGEFGHEISSFLVTNLPLVLGNFFRIFNIKDISSIDNKTILPIITNSFKQVNKNLSLQNDIDCTFSGSTCVSLIFTPKKVFCINIGDSRCILGKFDGKNWEYKNLSTDHKPNLETEKERIIKSGGIIRPMKDEDGKFIGPQRVWMKEANLPGLAMSRSFGDEVAHQIGVSCEPEIIEYELHEEDKFIILASDGIWEFMPNQECLDIVKDYYNNENCKGAVKHLYKESCKKWVEEENLIDDITLIIVFLK